MMDLFSNECINIDFIFDIGLEYFEFLFDTVRE